MSNDKLKVLLVEDDIGDAIYAQEILSTQKECPVEIVHVERLSLAQEKLGAGDIHVVLLDLSLPDSFGFGTFEKMYSIDPRVPIVILSGLDDTDTAMKAVSGGAQDYLVKGSIEGRLLMKVLLYAIERQKLLLKLQDALAEIKTLQSLLPICANCKKIRNDAGEWEAVDNYISKRTDTKFSHGICPDCIRLLYPEIADDVLGGKGQNKK